MNTAVTGKSSAWRSPWVRAWVGLILVFLSANLVMVVLAIRTNPGLVVANYYERGQQYEQTLLSRMSKVPPWRSRVDLPADFLVDQSSPVRLSIVDLAGTPVEVEAVTFYAYRPSDARFDFQVPMQREGSGQYRADVRFPLIGVWDVLVNVRRGEEDNNLGQRITVAQPEPGDSPPSRP